ncbi:hypothetical protein [Halocynthiibacter namhaensis]|uniref:hypothetical protein n=1 Tax=Halocynthiibacter namhaensis TaxID=1290553 RepID=UPI00068A8C81|nr:hypothetical protein [Halocynthiibacter namhaensis]
MWKQVKIAFRRHEYWVIRTAQKIPFLAIFIFATLTIWIIPLLPLIVLISLPMAVESLWIGIPWAILMLFLAMAGMFFVAPWYFRWCFICFGLMRGRTEIAENKENELKETLMRLAHV